jgi:hypothetical protein
MGCEEIARLEECTEYSMAAFTEFAVAGQEPQGCCRCQAPAVFGDWLLGVKWNTGKSRAT